MTQPRPLRSLLFVPGSRPERWEKALAAGADAVCIDLEDAVPPADKARARAEVCERLRGRTAAAEGASVLGVRINGLDTLDGFRDVAALADAGVQPDLLMIPKAEAAHSLRGLRQALGRDAAAGARVSIWAVVETPRGLGAAIELAEVCGADGGLLFGGADYSAALGVAMDWEPLLQARASLVHARAWAPGGLLDVPFLDVADAAGLAAECQRVKALGFHGKSCIHPAQVAVVNAAFAPADPELAWARRVVAAARASGGHAVLLDGKLLDTPIYQRAERILAHAGIEV